MASDFWAKQLGGSQPPPHVPPAPAHQGSAWWMSPGNAPPPPESYQQAGSGVALPQATYQQLKSMRADEMDQDQMEALASLELQLDKYNHVCERCGSTNFMPAGTKVNNVRMPMDKCFDCGTEGGPEAALGGRGKPGRATKQVGGGKGNYGQHHSQLPQQFIPRT